MMITSQWKALLPLPWVGALIVAASAILAPTAQAEFVIGDFEGALPELGWGHLTGSTVNPFDVMPFTGPDAVYTLSADGATTGSNSLEIARSATGFQANTIAYSATDAGTMAEFQSNSFLKVDFSAGPATADGWVKLDSLIVSSDADPGWHKLEDGAVPLTFVNGDGRRSGTAVFDYSSIDLVGATKIYIRLATNVSASIMPFNIDNVRLATTNVSLPGDYDGDGTVDGGDYSTWANSYGSTVNLNADGNGDSIVDAADYTIWRDNQTAPAVSVPEPGTIMLLSLGMLGVSNRRRCS